MKVEKISNNYVNYRQSFCSSLPRVNFANSVDSFVAMENKFISAETDLIRALAKRYPKLNKILKQQAIPGYDVPLLKTMLINPVFDDEKILMEIPSMLSIKWPREISNRQCAQGRKNIADLFATNPILNQNDKLRERIGEIILNCRSLESSNIVSEFVEKYMRVPLLSKNESLNKKLPDLIVNLQDGLYDAKIDKKGIQKGYNLILDKYLSSDKFYKNEKFSEKLGDMLDAVKDYETAVAIAEKLI